MKQRNPAIRASVSRSEFAVPVYLHACSEQARRGIHRLIKLEGQPLFDRIRVGAQLVNVRGPVRKAIVTAILFSAAESAT
jgi:hypothetical protein